jgi:ribonuclease HI
VHSKVERAIARIQSKVPLAQSPDTRDVRWASHSSSHKSFEGRAITQPFGKGTAQNSGGVVWSFCKIQQIRNSTLPWLVSCNGAWGVAWAEAAAILTSPSGVKLRYAVRLQFNSKAEKCTNNITECEAILLGLQKLRAIGVQRCTLRTDFKVVAGQIWKECITRDANLKKYLALVRRMENYFKGFLVEHIDRNKNTEADELVKAVARNTSLPADIFLQIISDASIKMIDPEPRIINVLQGEDWRAPIMTYLHHYYEPNTIVGQIRM